MNVPPWRRANSQLYSAVRAFPTWKYPVGDGAMRTRGPAVMGFRGYRPDMRSKDHHSPPGRPRVVAGAPPERLWQTGAMSDQVDLYKRAMAEFDRRVQAIQPSQWGSQTACSEWDVRAL